MSRTADVNCATFVFPFTPPPSPPPSINRFGSTERGSLLENHCFHFSVTIILRSVRPKGTTHKKKRRKNALRGGGGGSGYKKRMINESEDKCAHSGEHLHNGGLFWLECPSAPLLSVLEQLDGAGAAIGLHYHFQPITVRLFMFSLKADHVEILWWVGEHKTRGDEGLSGKILIRVNCSLMDLGFDKIASVSHSFVLLQQQAGDKILYFFWYWHCAGEALKGAFGWMVTCNGFNIITDALNAV